MKLTRFIITLCVGLLVLGLLARVGAAFWTVGSLETTDEPYYISMLQAHQRGEGFYPKVTGFLEPIHMFPGMGLALYSYAWIAEHFGLHVLALRAAGTALAATGVVAIYLTGRRLYGSQAGWVAAAFAASSVLLTYSVTIRMDAYTFAMVAWGLFITVHHVKRQHIGFHLLTGLILSMGLQVHLHTVIIAVACGLLYLVEDLRRWTDKRQWKSFTRTAGFVVGYAVGFAFFIVYNVLPDPETYFKLVTGVRTLSENMNNLEQVLAEPESTSLIDAAFSPRAAAIRGAGVLVSLVSAVPLIELALLVVAMLTTVLRRHPGDRYLRVLVLGTLGVGLFALKSPHAYYLTHFLPLGAIAVGAFVVYLNQPVQRSTLASLVILAAFGASTAYAQRGNLARFGQVVQGNIHVPATPEVAQAAYEYLEPGDTVAGPVELYLPHFTDYDYISTSPFSYSRALFVGGYSTLPPYWEQHSPKVFLYPEEQPGHMTFVASNGYEEMQPSVWVRP